MSNLAIWLKIAWAALTSRSNAAFYDRISPIYDKAFTTHRVHAITTADLLNRRFAGTEQETLVLDLGCGTGMLSRILADRGFPVLSLDISFESLRLLKRANKRIYPVQSDAVSLPVSSLRLQSVVSLGAWRHFADPIQVLDEIVRVLETEGTLIIGYFPPAIAGILDMRTNGLGGPLRKIYNFVTRSLGYADRVDAELETETLEAAKRRFKEVETVRSGRHWRLIVARNPIR